MNTFAKCERVASGFHGLEELAYCQALRIGDVMGRDPHEAGP